jgi:hypothetical protein
LSAVAVSGYKYCETADNGKDKGKDKDAATWFTETLHSRRAYWRPARRPYRVVWISSDSAEAHPCRDEPGSRSIWNNVVYRTHAVYEPDADPLMNKDYLTRLKLKGLFGRDYAE